MKKFLAAAAVATRNGSLAEVDEARPALVLIPGWGSGADPGLAAMDHGVGASDLDDDYLAMDRELAERRVRYRG
jgi:hypothetical protein